MPATIDDDDDNKHMNRNEYPFQLPTLLILTTAN
jgi:hypothetical protein